MADEDPTIRYQRIEHWLNLIQNDQARIEDAQDKIRAQLDQVLRALEVMAQHMARPRRKEK